jgi:hypothetical protein
VAMTRARTALDLPPHLSHFLENMRPRATEWWRLAGHSSVPR